MPNSHDRRTVIRGAATAMSALALPAVSYAARSKTLPPFFEDLERRTFNYFWDLGQSTQRPRSRPLADAILL